VAAHCGASARDYPAGSGGILGDTVATRRELLELVFELLAVELLELVVELLWSPLGAGRTVTTRARASECAHVREVWLKGCGKVYTAGTWEALSR